MSIPCVYLKCDLCEQEWSQGAILIFLLRQNWKSKTTSTLPPTQIRKLHHRLHYRSPLLL